MVNMMDTVLWGVSALTIFGSVLNVKKMSSSFFIWSLCNVFWLSYDIWNKSYARSVLDVVNLATSLWGLFSWIKDSHKKDEIEVTKES